MQNNYFEHINPKLGQLRGASGFRSLKRSVLPNNFAMWLGIATIVTSLLILLETGLSWYWQLLFILLILFFGPLLTQIYQSLFSGSDNVLTVYPGKQYIGYKVTLEKPISNGSGEVVLHDQVWGIYGDDLPSGTRVKIIAVKKNKLYVVTAMGSFDHQKIEAKD
ncbi:MAG: NfeD family protein [Cocleimonas sp.]|nr:NfeD family protein [Cocleimonas sp.]